MFVVLQTAVDSAIGMNDSAVIVDILNILLQKPYVHRLFLFKALLYTFEVIC